MIQVNQSNDSCTSYTSKQNVKQIELGANLDKSYVTIRLCEKCIKILEDKNKRYKFKPSFYVHENDNYTIEDIKESIEQWNK